VIWLGIRRGGDMVRNPEGRWRIKELNVDISPEVLENDSKKLERCIELFESFCIVSESVRQGIPINVKIIR
jgi:organic hydroperoxide reductase OsmC/OhrA